jgi:hypothetical protein
LFGAGQQKDRGSLRVVRGLAFNRNFKTPCGAEAWTSALRGIKERKKAMNDHCKDKRQFVSLREWIKQFENQFSARELDYMAVHKASIAAQLKDPETGNLHLHNLKYTAKDAVNLLLVKAQEPDAGTTRPEEE